MKQDHLNKCQLMHCNKSITDTLETANIAKRFTCANVQGRKFWVKYAHGWVEDEPHPLPPPPPRFKTLRRLYYLTSVLVVGPAIKGCFCLGLWGFWLANYLAAVRIIVVSMQLGAIKGI